VACELLSSISVENCKSGTNLGHALATEFRISNHEADLQGRPPSLYLNFPFANYLRGIYKKSPQASLTRLQLYPLPRCLAHSKTLRMSHATR